jgi:amino acid permease
MVSKSLLVAISILTGTMMGAGFLGIPYAVSKSGLIPGIIMLILIAGFMMLMKLYLGEVILRTKGEHQLAGYAEKYLGKKGKILMFFATFFGIYSALIAYLIGEGQSISYVLFGNFEYAFFISVFFWGILSTLSFIGLTALKRFEKIGLFIALIFIILICLFFGSNIKIENLTYVFPANLFFPFGIILFSFLAFSAMPEIRRVLVGKEKLLRKTVILGSGIVLLFYALFTFIIVGNFGQNSPEIATLALGRFFTILGVVTMFTAFFSATIAIRDVFRFDFGLGRYIGWILASFIPLICFLAIDLFNLISFIQLLSIAGVISGGLTGVLILFMNRKAKKIGNRKPEYSVKIPLWAIFLFIVVLFLGVFFELLI